MDGALCRHHYSFDRPCRMVVEEPGCGSAASKPDYSSSMACEFPGGGVRVAGYVALAHSETRWRAHNRVLDIHRHCCLGADLSGKFRWGDGVWTVKSS